MNPEDASAAQEDGQSQAEAEAEAMAAPETEAQTDVEAQADAEAEAEAECVPQFDNRSRRSSRSERSSRWSRVAAAKTRSRRTSDASLRVTRRSLSRAGRANDDNSRPPPVPTLPGNLDSSFLDLSSRNPSSSVDDVPLLTLGKLSSAGMCRFLDSNSERY